MSHGVHRGILKKGKTDDREIFINKLINKNKEIKFTKQERDYSNKSQALFQADAHVKAYRKLEEEK